MSISIIYGVLLLYLMLRVVHTFAVYIRPYTNIPVSAH
jgi:hypothetical protein